MCSSRVSVDRLSREVVVEGVEGVSLFGSLRVDWASGTKEGDC